MTKSAIVEAGASALAAVPATPESMLQQAIEAKMDPASMAEFYNLFRQMKADQAKAAFSAALSAFKAECPPVERRTTNTQFKTVNRAGETVSRKYASLEDIEATIRGPLGKHGLSFRWSEMAVVDNMLALRCIVSHVGGHSESSEVKLPFESKAGCSDQQKFGAAMTYAQRYSIIQALGLTSCDEDTDGNAEDSGERISADQAANLEVAVEGVSGDKPKFLKMLGVEKFSEIPLTKYGQALAAIDKKRKGGK